MPYNPKDLPIIKLNSREEINIQLKRKAAELIDNILDAINYGRDNNLVEVDVFDIYRDVEIPIIRFKLHRNKWKQFLENAMNQAIISENYELCNKIKKVTEIL